MDLHGFWGIRSFDSTWSQLHSTFKNGIPGSNPGALRHPAGWRAGETDQPLGSSLQRLWWQGDDPRHLGPPQVQGTLDARRCWNMESPCEQLEVSLSFPDCNGEGVKLERVFFVYLGRDFRHASRHAVEYLRGDVDGLWWINVPRTELWKKVSRNMPTPEEGARMDLSLKLPWVQSWEIPGGLAIYNHLTAAVKLELSSLSL